MQDNLRTRPILAYEDIQSAQPGNSTERLVNVRTYDPSIVARYNKPDMIPYLDDIILVRDALAQKLARVNSTLMTECGLHLKIAYGYRHPNVQKRYFEVHMAALHQKYPAKSEAELVRLTHNFVAVPEVAGHPTGGAIDVTLADSTGVELDMGTGIADYSDAEKVKTFAPGLTSAQAANRQILHDAMVDEGLAPFYGEWWHFSYGDREWATFYQKEKALYGAIELDLVA